MGKYGVFKAMDKVNKVLEAKVLRLEKIIEELRAFVVFRNEYNKQQGSIASAEPEKIKEASTCVVCGEVVCPSCADKFKRHSDIDFE